MRMTRREMMAGAALPLAARLRGQTAAPAAKPNVVLVLCDDLAAWMVGCYGNTEIKTPNIDAMARAGVRFINSNVCTPICSASRATLFTGRVPRQHGIECFLTPNPVEDPPQGQKAPPESFARELMLPQMLAQAGYRCGYVGKWHMGEDTKPGRGHELTYTFDGGSSRYEDPVMYLNGERREEKGYLAELITARAVEFLDKQKKGQPFMLTVSHFNPHTPYEGHPQKFLDMYAKSTFDTFGVRPAAANALREKGLMKDTLGNLRRCAASVSALDEQVGKLRGALLKRGFVDDTVVVFTSDNGYLLGRHGLWSKGLASDPINMYEEVMQVPMIWNWLGKMPMESARPEQISFYDFVPTVLDLAGVEAPAAAKLCGRSYLPLMMSSTPKLEEPWRDLVFGQFRNTEMARDGRFKLIERNDGEGPNELYDLKQDPREMTNRYEDPQYITVKGRLEKELEEWRERTTA